LLDGVQMRKFIGYDQAPGCDVFFYKLIPFQKNSFLYVT